MDIMDAAVLVFLILLFPGQTSSNFGFENDLQRLAKNRDIPSDTTESRDTDNKGLPLEKKTDFKTSGLNLDGLSDGTQRRSNEDAKKYARRLISNLIKRIGHDGDDILPGVTPTSVRTTDSVITRPNPTSGEIKMEHTRDFFTCPVLEPLLFNFFKGFPKTDDVTQTTDIKDGNFSDALNNAIKLLKFSNNPKLSSYQLAEDVADVILRERMRCPATKFQHVIVYMLKKELQQTLNAKDKSLYGNVMDILTNGLPGLPPKVVKRLVKMLVFSIHQGVFAEVSSALQMEEFDDLDTFLSETMASSRRCFQKHNESTDIEMDLVNLFKSILYRHPEALKCTPPKRLIEIHDNVLGERVRGFMYLKQAGMLMDFGSKFIYEMFTESKLQPTQQLIVKLGHAAVEYLKDSVQKFDTYQKLVSNHNGHEVIKFMEQHLSASQVNDTKLFMTMMGMFEMGTGNNTGGEYKFKIYLLQKLRHDIRQLKNVENIINGHTGTFDELKEDILVLIGEMLLKKKNELQEIIKN